MNNDNETKQLKNIQDNKWESSYEYIFEVDNDKFKDYPLPTSGTQNYQDLKMDIENEKKGNQPNQKVEKGIKDEFTTSNLNHNQNFSQIYSNQHNMGNTEGLKDKFNLTSKAAPSECQGVSNNQQPLSKTDQPQNPHNDQVLSESQFQNSQTINYTDEFSKQKVEQNNYSSKTNQTSNQKYIDELNKKINITDVNEVKVYQNDIQSLNSQIPWHKSIFQSQQANNAFPEYSKDNQNLSHQEQKFSEQNKNKIKHDLQSYDNQKYIDELNKKINITDVNEVKVYQNDIQSQNSQIPQHKSIFQSNQANNAFPEYSKDNQNFSHQEQKFSEQNKNQIKHDLQSQEAKQENNDNNQTQKPYQHTFNSSNLEHISSNQKPNIKNKDEPNIKNKDEPNPLKSITIEEIIEQAPLKHFSISIKQLIYDNLINSLSETDKKQNLHIVRCIDNNILPLIYDISTPNSEYIDTQDIFSYYKPPENESHWYLNFADTSLFGFYNSALYAQDELQCTEMPLLPHVKEYLQTQKEVPNLKPRTQEKDKPTPVLIMNVPRIGTIDIRPDEKYKQGLYGNNFRKLKEQDLNEKLTLFLKEDLVYTNIIAMSALGYGYGRYTKEQIEFTLLTAWKAFSQAVEKTKEFYHPKKCVIHTGNWGCGAFGNNYQLMAILQIFAANLAKVEKLYYHTFNKHGSNQYKLGKKIYHNILNQLYFKNQTYKIKVNEIIDEIFKQSFLWGQSDGN
ncbi:hypothetical protein ABPG72_009693 [Tetrahymena utriculariae]